MTKMIVQLKKASATGLFLILSLLALGQAGNFVTYGIEDGLIMSQIETIEQDNQGNLWIGTIGGLSKYDGTSFVNYTEKNGLAEDWVTRSFLDSRGWIWFGHWGGGVSVYQPDSASFSDLQLEKFSKYKSITCIAEDLNRNIWFGTENAGVFYHNPISKETIPFPSNLSSKYITSIHLDGNGKLWIGGDKGIDIIDTEKSNATLIASYNSKNGLASNAIKDITTAMHNEVWIATGNKGINRIHLSADFDYKKLSTAASKIETIGVTEGLTSNNINTIYEDHLNRVWIGTSDHGVVQFIPNNNAPNSKALIAGELNIFSNKFEMKYYHANCFEEDREGNLWLGTEIGLSKYMGELFKIYNHNDDLVNNLVWSILADKNENLWFGTTDGISKFSFPVIGGKRQFNTPIVTNYNQSNGLPENIVISLFEEKNGHIWVGTENKGVAIMDGSGKIVKTINTSNGLPDNKIFTIESDNNGFVWVGTRKGAGKINPETFKVEKIGIEQGIGGEKVYKLFKDSKGVLWFGILGGNLTSYDGKSFKEYDQSNGLSQKFILSIAEDKNFNLWFGAYGDGIIKYNGKTFTNYTTKDGLSSNSPHFITCDQNNNIWIGQSLGIEKFDQKTETFSLYGRQQGFSGLETNENAVCKDGSGNIWFGTIRGAIKFAPEMDKKNSIEPLTYIKGFKIYLQDKPLREDGRYSYDENYLTFNVLGISLTNPNEVRYQYKMEGFDKDWSPPRKTTSITYSNLSPGDYSFMVKASNNSDLWNKEPVVYSFTISPPFWQTWWFYGICLIAIILGIYAYIKWRERKLKEHQAYLESEVAKRTEELRAEKEIVELQNTEITKKNQNITESISYAKRIQEAILPPMNEIQKSLPDFFILYKPKDIVSGDFYWIHESNNKILFAAVDCTGHGVPGAFMSIIGHNLLEKVVKEKNIDSPSKILNVLSHEIIQVLRQDARNSDVKDGMDLAICSIDKKTNELKFAGAHNPLYLIRDKEILEFKSDKKGIGKGNIDDHFEEQNIKLKKNDILYIFSDGYADQKGGPKMKKFFYPPFRELLLDIHLLPMEEQRNKLEKTIIEWKGEVEQYDDMLVFGVKM